MDRINQTEALFYGKVTDLEGVPIPFAPIRYSIPYGLEYSSLKESFEMKADEAGLFRIQKKGMPAMSVSVTPLPGYSVTNQSSQIFSFAEISPMWPAALRQRALPPHKADPANPVLFTLRKEGWIEPLVLRNERQDLPTEIPWTIGNSPEHQLVLKFQFDPKPRKHPGEGTGPAYDWSAEFSVPGGGLIERPDPRSEEPLSFLAPASGYQPSFRHEYRAETADIHDLGRLRKQFFVRFSDGTYARVAVSLNASSATGQFCRVESFYNPSGSNATEFDLSLAIPVKPENR